MENEVIKNIKDDIKEQAQLVIDQIEYESSTFHDDELAHYKAGLKKEQDTYLEKELNDLEVLAVTEASRQKMDTKRKLLSLREELVSQLFDDVKKRLIAFTKTKDYEEYLKEKMASIPFDGGVIYARTEDIDLIKKELKAKDVEVKEAYFEIGGLTYISKSQDTEYDLSLDTNFKSQTEWFIDHSGFTI